MRNTSPTLLMLLFVAFVACGESYFVPSSAEIPEATIATPPPTSPENTTPGVTPAEHTECDVIQLVRSSIKSETDCKKGVRFYLEAPGATYFNIHLGGLNKGAILGPNTPGQWSKWYKLEPGSYSYTAAAQAEIDGSTIQCDHHNKTFTIPGCSADCLKPPPPECEFGAAIYNPGDCTWQCPPCYPPPMPACPSGVPTLDPGTCTWMCPPCVKPPAPTCPFGPAIWDGEACKWICPPCIMPPKPTCPSGREPIPDPTVTCTWSCPSCTPPPPPTCPYGPPTYDPVTCIWTCPPCVLTCDPGFRLDPIACICICKPVGKPECPEQKWSEETCAWEGDCLCEYSISHAEVGEVFCHDLVRQKNECSHFAPGTAQIGYDDGSTPIASMSADVVIVKAGGGGICGKEKRYIVYENVTVGDPLTSDWSHTTYCNCENE